MTFAFKDIPTLKAGLERLISIYDKPLEKIHEPRRSELLFVKTILQAVELTTAKTHKHLEGLLAQKAALNADTPPKEQKQLAKRIEKAEQMLESLMQAYYGAMLVARKHTYDLKGKLAKNMAETVGIDAQDQPSKAQIARFFQALNGFLQLELFPEARMTQRFHDKHLFGSIKSVDKTKLHELLLLGFQSEQIAQQEFINELEVNGDPLGVEVKYDVKLPTPESALNAIPKWDALKLELENIVRLELKKANVSIVKELDKTRFAQITFLETIAAQLSSTEKKELRPAIDAKATDAIKQTVELRVPHEEALREAIAMAESPEKAAALELELANAKNEERAAILAGAMLFVHRQIKFETTLSSIVYNTIGTQLKVDTLSSADMESLLQATNQYARNISMADVPVSAQKNGIPKTMRANPLASKAFLCDFQEYIAEQRAASLEKVIKTLGYSDAPAKETEASTSWLGGSIPTLSGALSTFGIMRAPKPAKEDIPAATATPAPAMGSGSAS